MWGCPKVLLRNTGFLQLRATLTGVEMLITTPGITEQEDTSFSVSGTDQQMAKNLVLVQNIKVSHHYPKNGNQIYTITFFKKV